MTDSGEAIRLIDNHGHEAALFSHATWPDAQSLVRTSLEDGTFVPHKTASPTETPFSPGHAPKTRPALTYSLIINEALADPPEGTAGDANRDGRRNPYEDEFVELYNTGPVSISLADWQLGNLSGYFRFPSDAVIEPDSYVVLFGGGNPSEFTVPVYTDDGSIGDGLTDTGEAIYLIDDHGHEVSFLSQSTWPEDQSIVRISPDSSAFVRIKPSRGLRPPSHPGTPQKRQSNQRCPSNLPMPSSSAKCSPTRLKDQPATLIAMASATRMKTNLSNCTTPVQIPSP